MNGTQHPGLQISVIIFVFLTVALAVSTFYFYDQWSATNNTLGVVKAAKERSATQERLKQQEAEQLKTMIGVDVQEKLENVKTTYDDDMKKYAHVFERPHDKDKKHQAYHTALEKLLNRLEEDRKAIDQERLALTAMQDNITTLDTNWKSRIASVKEVFDQRIADFDAELAKYDEEYRRLQEEKGELDTAYQQKNEAIAAVRTEMETKQTALKKDLQVAESGILSATKDRNAITNDTFEIPDGQIRWVSPNDRIVWINLGFADQLKKQITFSVYNRADNAVGRGARKAAIEVTKVLSENLAEARILEDDVTDTILPGDLIYTPLWHPGRQEHFAVAGFIDLDGDSVGDHQAVIDLIGIGGGVVDCQVTPDGKVEGQISIGTRYLLVGDVNVDVTNPASKAAADAVSKLSADAREKGVQIIPLATFLEQVGYAGGYKVITLGKYSNPADFNDVHRESEKYSRGPLFRPRRPPAAGKSSAYSSSQ
jgi:hypothetical protein